MKCGHLDIQGDTEVRNAESMHLFTGQDDTLSGPSTHQNNEKKKKKLS